MVPAAQAELLEGERGLIVGIANDQSIAWDSRKRSTRSVPTSRSISQRWPVVRRAARARTSTQIVLPLDARCLANRSGFRAHRRGWGDLGFVVHSIAFSPKDELRGARRDVSREGSLTTMEVSCSTLSAWRTSPSL